MLILTCMLLGHTVSYLSGCLYKVTPISFLLYLHPGCPTSGYYNGSDCCPDVNCQYCHIETGICQDYKPEYQCHRCELGMKEILKHINYYVYTLFIHFITNRYY